MQSPLANLVLGRRGARLAEALTISAHPLPRASRLRRQKGAAAAAAAAAAPAREAAARGPGHEDSGSSGGGSGTTSVVSAPDWPPVKQQQAAASTGEQQQRPRKRSRQQHLDKTQQEGHSPARQQQRPQEPQQHSPQQQQQEELPDVRAFLRSTGGGSGLRLEAWEHADAAAKRLKAQLLLKVCWHGWRGLGAALLRWRAGLVCSLQGEAAPCCGPAPSTPALTHPPSAIAAAGRPQAPAPG